MKLSEGSALGLPLHGVFACVTRPRLRIDTWMLRVRLPRYTIVSIWPSALGLSLAPSTA